MRTLLLASPWLLGGVTGLVWAGQVESLAPVHGLALLLWLAGGAWLWHEWRRPAVGVLRWDGLQWHWESAQARHAGRVQPRLDWQRGLLLEFLTLDGRRRWLWPERATAPLQWPALRCALFAPAPADPTRPAGGAAGDGP